MPDKPDAKQLQSPRGTRDLYPAEAARRRWLMDRWRDVSVRHGFEEVDGPTFETADLYAVKSGDGILGELFQAFSGKSPEEVEQVRETGRAPYALRPEFTPTLARMYAAKAAGLPKPCKWFMAGPFFRAERPQRGRLREFLQWNCDVLGLDVPPEKWNAEDAESRAEVAEAKARMDAECIACCVAYLRECGFESNDVRVSINLREISEDTLAQLMIEGADIAKGLSFLDRLPKMSQADAEAEAGRVGITDLGVLQSWLGTRCTMFGGIAPAGQLDMRDDSPAYAQLVRLTDCLCSLGIADWCRYDASITRGLAYYTGTVFEVIADGERAVAGGGRYDNLVELFGGPHTPAVGFAMGDVVLSLLLQDKGLMPSDEELMGLVGQRPHVFVMSNGTEEAESKLRPTVANLRRGADGIKGLHVRHSYKATKNVGKLLKEANNSGARFAVIIEDADTCTVKDLASNQQWDGRVTLSDLPTRLNQSEPRA